MATTITKYTHTHRRFADGTLDWDTDTFKVALVTSAYTFSAAHTQWEDVSTHEVATGTGYTTGGVTMTNTLDNTKLDASDVTWAALTKTFRYAVIYCNKTTADLTNPVVACILFDDAPADIEVSGIDFVIMWNADGVFSLS
jgi:hypothetical protein